MLNKLIQEGEGLTQYIEELGARTNGSLKGEEYSLWIAKCVRYLELNYPNSELTKMFVKESENAFRNKAMAHYNLLGIIKAFKLFKEIEYNRERQSVLRAY